MLHTYECTYISYTRPSFTICSLFVFFFVFWDQVVKHFIIQIASARLSQHMPGNFNFQIDLHTHQHTLTSNFYKRAGEPIYLLYLSEHRRRRKKLNCAIQQKFDFKVRTEYKKKRNTIEATTIKWQTFLRLLLATPTTKTSAKNLT